jgi:hypothetical protein
MNSTMRWMGVVVTILSASCLLPAEAIDAGSAIDAGPPFDPCAWNGRDGYCFLDGWGYVFTQGTCTSVCAASSGTNGTIFRTRAACQVTCGCRREKFVSADASEPFVEGGRCDRVVLVPRPGVDMAEWDCRAGKRDGTCSLNVNTPFALDDLGTICAYSSLPEVEQVICVVEP